MGNQGTKVPQAVAQPFATKDIAISQQLVGQIPWGHNILLMEKVKDLPIRLWYMSQTIHNPIGISDYELTRALPENLKSSLPTVEEIEAELGGDLR